MQIVLTVVLCAICASSIMKSFSQSKFGGSKMMPTDGAQNEASFVFLLRGAPLLAQVHTLHHSRAYVEF